jgi:hypothetical protein
MSVEDSPIQYIKTAVKQMQDELISSDSAPWVKAKPEVIYHYTDVSGAQGILKESVLYATDLRFMNDAGELQYARHLIKKVLVAERKACTSSIRDYLDVMSLALEIVNMRFYACCFCEDGDLLSQWRAYANAGKGYAIGFRTESLANDLTRNTGILLQCVEYDPASQRSRIASVLRRFIDLGNQCADKFKHHPDFGEAMRYCFRGAMLPLFIEQASLKDPLFREEREWRLVKIEREGHGFRVSRAGLLVPYVRIPFVGPGDFPSAVAEIRWGPTLAPELTRLSLDEYCKSCGYKDLQIKGSMISFRG